MYKILVVDDEKKMREFMSFFIKKDGYDVIEAKNGKDAVEIVRNQDISLVLLDLMMPEMDGFEACKKIRAFSSVPVIMITAVGGENEHINGYQIGVDDYITKPFKTNILMAKINRILGKSMQGFKQYDTLKINEFSMEILIEDHAVELAPKEYDLLVYMIENKNQVLSRNQILDYIWGFEFEGGTRVVDNHIKKLRHKLNPFSENIKTVINHGYKLEV